MPPKFRDNDWLPEDEDVEEEGSFSEDYDWDFDQKADEYWHDWR
jgi:hypothetical protein